MSSYFTEPAYVPCTMCGTSLSPDDHDTHVCDAGRRERFEAFQLQHTVASFERELSTYLASPAGRFELFYAERDRRRRTR